MRTPKNFFYLALLTTQDYSSLFPKQALSAVLLAEACNIGLTPVIHPEIPALTRDRLSWVRHHFVRAETITRANACLVQAQRPIPLAQVWGGGYVASVDGLRFVVPIRSVNTGPTRAISGKGAE